MIIVLQQLYLHQKITHSKPVVGDTISGNDVSIEEGEIRAFIHYAGTTINEQGDYVSAGGRVLSATGIAPTLNEAVEAAYQIINNIELKTLSTVQI